MRERAEPRMDGAGLAKERDGSQISIQPRAVM